ncbi:MAG: hypothetical protein ACLFVP_05105 [Candidatus Bathyarchaeia archaeon]
MDFKELFKEINEVFRRYEISKGIGFVPDDLEIHLSREEDLYKLEYVERFTYLPSKIRDTATDNAVRLLMNMGVPKSGIETLEDGVRVKMSGHHRVVLFPILELLIQNPRIEEELPERLGEIRNAIESLTSLLEFQWNYDDETREEIKRSINDLAKIIEENPEIQREVEDIIKRHMEKK